MNPLDTTELIKAKDRLLNGDVVAIPTETVYGLAASIESEAGLRRIFALKERPFFDPLIVHVASFKQAQTLVSEWPPLADYLSRVFWPGPLTLVLPKNERVHPLITSGLETVAIRQPAHPIALDLIKLLGHPIAAPSANKFGKTSPSRPEHVRAEFPNDAIIIVNGGPCEVGIESTVIAFGKTAGDADEIQILRPGAVTKEMLSEALTKWSGKTEIRTMASDASPGNLKHHYMPDIPLIIVPADEPDGLSMRTRTRIEAELKKGSLRFPTELVLDSDPALAARELYSRLRELSSKQGQADVLYVKQSPARAAGGLWQGIWDRLTRAASLDLGAT